MRIQQIANTRTTARPRALPSFALAAALGWALLPMAATGEPPRVAASPARNLAPLRLLPAVLTQSASQVNQPSLDDLMPGTLRTGAWHPPLQHPSYRCLAPAAGTRRQLAPAASLGSASGSVWRRIAIAV